MHREQSEDERAVELMEAFAGVDFDYQGDLGTIVFLVTGTDSENEQHKFIFSKREYAESKRNELLESREEVFKSIELETFLIDESEE